MAEHKNDDSSQKKTNLKSESVNIEININDKTGTTIGKPSLGNFTTGEKAEKAAEKTKEKAKDILENLKEKEKEIDLLEVSGNVAKSVKKGSVVILAFLWKIVKLIFIVLYRIFNFGLNSWKWAVIVGIIGAGSTYYLYNTSEAYYNSDGYGVTRITSNQEIIQIINSISIPNDSLKFTLKNDLNLAPEVYNNILSLKASWLIDENGDGISDFVDYNNNYAFDKEKDSLSVRMKDRFNVRLQVRNQTITDEVQTALLKYLYDHPFIKNLNYGRLNTIEGMVRVYGDQAQVLDSLQYYEYFVEKQESKNTLNGFKFGEFELLAGDDQKDKRLYHEDIISLKENAISSKSSLIYNTEPILFVGNLNNTSSRANNLMFYAKRVAYPLIPLALLFFIIFKRTEIERIFHVKDLLED